MYERSRVAPVPSCFQAFEAPHCLDRQAHLEPSLVLWRSPIGGAGNLLVESLLTARKQHAGKGANAMRADVRRWSRCGRSLAWHKGKATGVWCEQEIADQSWKHIMFTQ